jgi:hypothetical protein
LVLEDVKEAAAMRLLLGEGGEEIDLIHIKPHR